ncbi:MAG: element excision factor XisH family protein [Chloroflexota bacterium]
MPAKDIIHDAVCNALNKDGWKITHEHMKSATTIFCIASVGMV